MLLAKTLYVSKDFNSLVPLVIEEVDLSSTGRTRGILKYVRDVKIHIKVSRQTKFLNHQKETPQNDMRKYTIRLTFEKSEFLYKNKGKLLPKEVKNMIVSPTKLLYVRNYNF